MALLRIDDSAVEPISLDEAKAHLRLDTDDDDALVSSLITAARVHIEQVLGHITVEQTWVEVRDAWPAYGPGVGGEVRLSLGPVRNLLEIRVVDPSGSAASIPASDYFTDVVSVPARIGLTDGAVWPQPGRAMNGIEIEFTAGYGLAAEDVPQPLRQAVLLLVAHWYEQREPVAVGSTMTELPHMVAGLVAPFRMPRLG